MYCFSDIIIYGYEIDNKSMKESSISLDLVGDTDIYKTILSDTELVDSKKAIVEQVTIRVARSGDKPPLIVSIPRSIADKAKLEIGDTMLMFTDGDKIVITRPVMPK